MQFGLPQGSVLGPKGFTQYAEDVAAMFIKNGLIFNLYADDMQGLKHGKPIEVPAIVAAHETCVAKVSSLCTSKQLQLSTTTRPRCSGSAQQSISTRLSLCHKAATCELVTVS